MATMISEVFAAFKSAGVDDDRARAAAEAMAAQGERLMDVRDELRGEIRGVRDELRDVRDELRGEIHTWRDELRGEIRTVRDELRGEIRTVRDEARSGAAKLREGQADLRGSVRLLQWQVAALYAMFAGVFWLLFRVAAKVGALPG